MKKVKNKKKNVKVSNEKLIEEIGRITVQLEELRDENKKLKDSLQIAKEREIYIKCLVDQYKKFREDLVGFITRY
jgi:hypothetical protein